mgnify:CR=1 FL=1
MQSICTDTDGIWNKESKSIQYINVMRYAGAYFIAAEAYSRQTGQEGKAIEKMNEYLEACQATPMEDDLTGTDLIEAIHKEKQKEFAGGRALLRFEAFALGRFVPIVAVGR